MPNVTIVKCKSYVVGNPPYFYYATVNGKRVGDVSRLDGGGYIFIRDYRSTDRGHHWSERVLRAKTQNALKQAIMEMFA